MFINIPFTFDAELQNAALIINTALLIIALVVIELVYSEIPKDRRPSLKLFLGFGLVLIGMLIFAVIKQFGGV